MGGSHIDDATKSILFHARPHGLTQLESRGKIDGYYGIPLFIRKCINRRNVLYSCIIDQNIDMAKPIKGSLHQEFYFSSFRQIGRRKNIIYLISLSDLTGYCCSIGFYAIEDNVIAQLCKSDGCRLANTTCASRDQYCSLHSGKGRSIIRLLLRE